MLESMRLLNYICAKNNLYGEILNKKIVKFNGGLGNQMFQYAFACAISKKYNSEIVFDFSYFDEVKKVNSVATRFFELNVFNFECKEATKQDLELVKKPEFDSKLKKSIAKRFPKLFGINYVREKHNYVFDKNLINMPYYFYDGYFQHEKYFKSIKNELIEKFTLKIPLDEANQAALNQILETNSVSIHVRRGDYVEMDYAKNVHGACSLEYYKKAIEYVLKNIKNPHFFLFSDDIQWVIENLKIDFPYTVINFNQGKGWLDLNLMKNCKHNIIANSSFSWWGAWLNKNPNKIVIAPTQWLVKKTKCDIIPKEWIKL